MVLPGSLHVRMTVVFLMVLCTAAASNAAVFVNCDAPSGGDGTTWATAFQHVQDGLTAATTSNNEVWVAEGTYGQNVFLRAGMRLYGGFSGTETSRFQRDPAAHPTIIDGGQAGNTVIGANEAVIDGFTITNGKPATNGGGVYCSYVSPTISNCKITQNAGAGVYCYQSSPTITNCEITENTDKGVYCYINGNANITGCIIADNAAVQYAGIYCDSATPSIRRCMVTGNHTTGTDARGGGMSFVACPSGITVENSVIEGNSASVGGGVYCSTSSPSFVNCTISDNSAVTSGGNAYLVNSNSAFRNTILSYGIAPIGGAVYKNTASSPTFDHCDFWQNGTNPFEPASWDPTFGGDNRIYDPLFVDRPSGNFHLMSASFLIDAGTSASAPVDDLDGNPRPQGAGFDIGAYEYGPAPSFNTIVDVKRERDGERVAISDVVISGAFDGFFYIEQQDRVAGIRVVWPEGVPMDHAVSVSGFLETRNGIERQIRADGVIVGDSAVIEPLGMGNRSLIGGNFEYHAGPPASGQMGKVGTGPNNVGLLVRTWGRVTAPTTSSFVLDDGSDIYPTVVVPAEVTPPSEGDFVRVTGISSLQGTPEDLLAIILARSSSDLVPLNQ